MSLHEQIKKAIQDMITVPTIIVMGEVVSVDGFVCSIKLANGLEVPDVQLRQTITESDNYWLRKPKKGAGLTAISLTGDLSNLIMLEASEYESFSFVQDKTEFTIDSVSGKFTVKNENVSLFDLFQKQADIIKQLTVPTPSGLSGTPSPPTVQAVTQFETKFKQLLKQ